MEGAKWLRRLGGHVVGHVRNGSWPNSGWWGWSELADLLRPDELGSREKRVLYRFLTGASSVTRARCIDLLLSPPILQGYKSVTANGSRGDLDREILAQVQASVQDSDDEIDHLIRYVVELIDAYEQVSVHLESVFRGLMWALTRRGGRSSVDDLLGDSMLTSNLVRTRRRLTGVTKRLQTLMSGLTAHAQVLDAVNQERLDRLIQDALDGLSSEQALVDAVMQRHRRVQENKRKGNTPWAALLVSHPPIAELDHAASVRGIPFRVGHLHNRRPGVVERLEQIHDLRPLTRVKIARGLIGQDDRRAGDEGPRHADQLLLTAGELAGIEILLPHDLKPIERVRDETLPLGAAHIAIRQGDLGFSATVRSSSK